MSNVPSDIDALNERFGLREGLHGDLRFDQGEGGLTRARIATAAATAEIYLQGAHVARWQPADAAQRVLFLSEKSHFAAGKAIRGGVPLVFPWFAERGNGLPGPMHGFARTVLWSVVAAERHADGVELTFELRPDQSTRDLGYGHFLLLYRVRVGRTLTLRLEVENLGNSPLSIEEAFHAYFAVSDVRQIAISGLAGTDYLDRANGARPSHQEATKIRFTGETDQLHLNTSGSVTIDDPKWQRRIVIEKQNSSSTVVWNPWSKKAAGLADLGADAWPGMVCVEPANAAANAVVVLPGAKHTMGMMVQIEAL